MAKKFVTLWGHSKHSEIRFVAFELNESRGKTEKIKKDFANFWIWRLASVYFQISVESFGAICKLFNVSWVISFGVSDSNFAKT